MSQRGSIHRRGDKWIAYWRSDTAKGRKQHTKVFRTKKEAQEFLNDTLAAIRGGVFSEPSKVTFGEYLIERPPNAYILEATIPSLVVGCAFLGICAYFFRGW